MSDEKDQIEKVKEMAKLAVLSNRINEVQETSLKNYPFIVFDGIKEFKLDYDLSYEKMEKDNLSPKCVHQPFVAYYLKIDESRNTEALQFRFEAIEKWVRNLFWKNVSVEIYFNDKIVFKSKK